MKTFEKLTFPPGPLTSAYLALNEVYVETRRHQEALAALKRTVLAGATSGRHKGLAIIGPTGSGKTATVKHAERWIRQELGLTAQCPTPLPVVLMTTRSTGKAVANSFLRAGRDPLAGTRTQDDAEAHIRETSSDMDVVGFAVDEFHNVFSGKSESEALRMSLTIKTLVNSLAKPMIVMGIPGLEHQIDANEELRQRFERKVYLEDPRVSSQDDVLEMRKVLQALNAVLPHEGDCDLGTKGMQIRLLYAAQCRFGSVVDLVRSACEFGAMERQETVLLKNYASAYRDVAPQAKRDEKDNAFLMPLDIVHSLVKQMQDKQLRAGARS